MFPQYNWFLFWVSNAWNSLVVLEGTAWSCVSHSAVVFGEDFLRKEIKHLQRGWCWVVLLVWGRCLFSQLVLNTSPNAVFPNTNNYRPISHFLSRMLHKLYKLQFPHGPRNISPLGVKAVLQLEVHAVPFGGQAPEPRLTSYQDPLVSPVGWGCVGEGSSVIYRLGRRDTSSLDPFVPMLMGAFFSTHPRNILAKWGFKNLGAASPGM